MNQDATTENSEKLSAPDPAQEQINIQQSVSEKEPIEIIPPELSNSTSHSQSNRGQLAEQHASNSSSKEVHHVTSSSSSPSQLPAVTHESFTSHPPITLRRHHRHPPHVLHPTWHPYPQRRLLNSLLPAVGFLELTNALDFPANVWQMIPVPAFAIGLMATGGSVALLFTLVACYDFILARRNIQLLREERRWLKRELDNINKSTNKTTNTNHDGNHHLLLLQSYLDLNTRSLGWEAIDRSLLDLLNGFAGILVGVGTLLAIGGANPHIFLASNLLSGYIGNSFNALYSAINTVWSFYMWRRARRHEKAVMAYLRQRDDDGGEMRGRMRRHARRHQIYAGLNGVSVLVAGVGSMVSATMWQGYVVLIPCAVSAVVCNLLWRRGCGYEREMVTGRAGGAELGSWDVEAKLRWVIEAQGVAKAKGGTAMIGDWKAKEVVRFMIEHELFQELCAQLLQDLGKRRHLLGVDRDVKEATIDVKMLEAVPAVDVVQSARRCLSHKGYARFRDQERMLAELWGCQLSLQRIQLDHETEHKSLTEKDV